MQITYETVINAPADRVWEVLNDFGNVQNFHPLVLESHLLTDVAGGQGADRRCDFGKGVALYERIVDCTEERSMDVDIYRREGMPSVVRSMSAHFELAPTADGTQVVGTIGAVISPRVAAIAMNLILKRQLTKAWRQLLADLKHHAETNELIGLESPLDLDAVAGAAPAGG